jgi:hypothetical protein
MELPKITNKQLEILLHLYKFYYLNTKQLQKLLNHKNPTRILAWLRDLNKKEYVVFRDFDRKKFINNTKPAIYTLTKLARKKLKENPNCELPTLNRVYQEESNSLNFVCRQVFLADIFLHMQANLEKDQQLHFSTKANLVGFNFFPDPIPESYISIKSPNKTNRSFLYLLEEKIPMKVLVAKIRKLTDYADNNEWEKYSKGAMLPSFLIICPPETRKRQVNNLIKESFTSGAFYLTTKTNVQQSGFHVVWQKVK